MNKRYSLFEQTLFAFVLFFLFAGYAPGLASSQPPTIVKIEPPDWFIALPDPMLLIQGTGLSGSSFSVSGSSVTVLETRISPNGHWAMLSLDTHRASAGSVQITAQTQAGSTSFGYHLSPRRATSDGMSGVSSSDVLYLILPDRFADGDPANDRIPGSPSSDRNDPHAYHGGDLKGVVNHLDYLQQLGVTALWLTPVLKNDSTTRDYHGYGATDLYAIEPRLGSLAEYQNLADELHRRGMKLIFDDVPNHVGQGNIWVTDPPLPDWFHGTAAHHLENTYGFPTVTDPHAAPEASLDALDGWFANILPDLNQQDPVVARYLTQNVIWWIEKTGLDGLRIDTFPYVQRDFWQSYLGTLNSLYPHLTSIGEVTTEDATVNAFFAGGRTLAGVDTHLTTPFDYPLYDTLLDVLVKGKPMSQLEETLRKDWLYPRPEALVPFLSNHDQVRFLSQPGASPALLRLGFGLLLTLRGMPQLYAGDEVLMKGGGDPDNRRDFPGGFPGDSRDAFAPADRTSAEAAMHDWVAALGTARAHSPALQTGRMQTLLATESGFAYLRTLSSGASACDAPRAMLIAVSRSTTPQTLKLPVQRTALAGCHTLTSRLGDDSIHTPQAIPDQTLTLHLPANGFALYDLR